MPQLVHVIKPTGTRFERRFADNMTPAQILAALDRVAPEFGYLATVDKSDPAFGRPVMFGDPGSGLALAAPETVVAIVEPAPDGSVREIKRLRGPGATK